MGETQTKTKIQTKKAIVFLSSESHWYADFQAKIYGDILVEKNTLLFPKKKN